MEKQTTILTFSDADSFLSFMEYLRNEYNNNHLRINKIGVDCEVEK